VFCVVFVCPGIYIIFAGGSMKWQVIRVFASFRAWFLAQHCLFDTKFNIAIFFLFYTVLLIWLWINSIYLNWLGRCCFSVRSFTFFDDVFFILLFQRSGLVLGVFCYPTARFLDFFVWMLDFVLWYDCFAFLIVFNDVSFSICLNLVYTIFVNFLIYSYSGMSRICCLLIGICC